MSTTSRFSIENNEAINKCKLIHLEQLTALSKAYSFYFKAINSIKSSQTYKYTQTFKHYWTDATRIEGGKPDCDYMCLYNVCNQCVL